MVIHFQMESTGLDEMTHILVVDLHIGADEYVRHYSGAANAVVARARNGQTVKFPATILRPFVMHDGVHGTFSLLIDDRSKLLSIDRID